MPRQCRDCRPFSSEKGSAGSDAGWGGVGRLGQVTRRRGGGTEPVVVEPAEPVAGSFDLLDDEVHRFGGSVGGAGVMMVQDLGAPPGEGAAEIRISGTSSPVLATFALSMSTDAWAGSSTR